MHKKNLKTLLGTQFQAYDFFSILTISTQYYIYQIVLCAELHAKHTRFELLYTRKCQKHLKNLKIKLTRNLKLMTIIFDSNNSTQ